MECGSGIGSVNIEKSEKRINRHSNSQWPSNLNQIQAMTQRNARHLKVSRAVRNEKVGLESVYIASNLSSCEIPLI